MATVTVTYHEEDGSWWAESPDVAGFTAVGASLTEVRELVHEGIPFYLEDDDDVDVRELLEDGRPLRVVRALALPWGWRDVAIAGREASSSAAPSRTDWSSRYSTDSPNSVHVGAA